VAVDLDEYTTPAGQDLDSVARSARELILKLFGVDDVAGGWEEASEGIKERWREAVAVVFSQCLSEVEVSWDILAERAASAFGGVGQQKSLEPALRIRWEAVVRHASNLILAEDGSDVDAVMSHDWRPWILEKSKEMEREQNSDGT
jgi:hypothetical protein